MFGTAKVVNNLNQDIATTVSYCFSLGGFTLTDQLQFMEYNKSFMSVIGFSWNRTAHPINKEECECCL